MADIKTSDIRILDAAFQADAGYVLNFSNKTFSEFFDEEFGIDIDAPKYQAGGTSKMNRLRTFCRIESNPIVAKALRRLWRYREEQSFPNREAAGNNLSLLISRLEGANPPADTSAIDVFVPDETLQELVASIERDMAADKPAAAMDRLHTYCAKKFGHLLDERGIAWDRSAPLHNRVGTYVRALSAERQLRDMTLQIIKNSIGVFDKFNHVRNNQSLAHDNVLLDKAEARFIFDSVSAVLHFFKRIDADRYKD